MVDEVMGAWREEKRGEGLYGEENKETYSA
jgi:hypothetical protein